jgi:flagellar protein FliO/FliZ
MAVSPWNGLASLPVMVVSLLSNARWALVACAWLMLAPPRALAEAPASVPPASSAKAPALASPPAVVKAPAPSLPPAQAPSVAPAPAQPAAVAPAIAQPAAAAVQPPAPAPAPGSELPDPFAAEVTAAEEPENVGWVLARTLLLLIAVLAGVYLTLNVGLRRLMGLQSVVSGRQSLVSVVERVQLDQRRTLFVLKAADEYLLVGSGEGGLQLLSKLDTQAVDRIQAERPPPTNVIPLSPFLQKLLSRRTGSTPPRS